MKFLLGDSEIDLPASVEGVSISDAGDRLLVRTPEGAFSAVAIRQGKSVLISFRGRTYRLDSPGQTQRASGTAASGELRAGMPGLIVQVLVQQGQSVARAQKLLVLEAMKTQQPVLAPFEGVVSTLEVAAGAQVSEGQLLATIVAPKEAVE